MFDGLLSLTRSWHLGYLNGAVSYQDIHVSLVKAFGKLSENLLSAAPAGWRKEVAAKGTPAVKGYPDGPALSSLRVAKAPTL
jgi:hypothetical protein